MVMKRITAAFALCAVAMGALGQGVSHSLVFTYHGPVVGSTLTFFEVKPGCTLSATTTIVVKSSGLVTPYGAPKSAL